MNSVEIQSCAACGLTQRVRPLAFGERAACRRCRHVVCRHPRGVRHRRELAAALALAALLLYPVGVAAPMLGIERFGHHHVSSILTGTATLLSEGEIAVGLIVLVCSIVLPLGKLGAILLLSLAHERVRRMHRIWIFHAVEWTGRWGMLDVLLVAVLVAALKIGDLVTVTIGPAAVAFAGCVALSLLASSLFDPRDLWGGGQPASIVGVSKPRAEETLS